MTRKREGEAPAEPSQPRSACAHGSAGASPSRLLLALLVFAGCAFGAAAADMKEMDCGAKVSFLKSHFDRYPSASKAFELDAKGIHFFLSPRTKDPKQTGLASMFTIAGDFEISAAYAWTPVVIPKDGYGVSIGIFVDTDTWSLGLARGNFPGEDSGYRVTHAKKAKGEKDVFTNDKVIPNKAKSGRLMLRREKKEVICLSAEDGATEVTELARFPLTADSVRKIRFIADPGDAPTHLDAHLTQIRIRAEEITTNIPIREQGLSIWWWIGGFAVVMVGAVAAAFVVIRRRQAPG